MRVTEKKKRLLKEGEGAIAIVQLFLLFCKFNPLRRTLFVIIEKVSFPPHPLLLLSFYFLSSEPLSSLFINTPQLKLILSFLLRFSSVFLLFLFPSSLNTVSRGKGKRNYRERERESSSVIFFFLF